MSQCPLLYLVDPLVHLSKPKTSRQTGLKQPQMRSNLLRVSIESNERRGRGGIRTHGTVTRTPDFESGTFNHSATLPQSHLFLYRGRFGGVRKLAIVPAKASG